MKILGLDISSVSTGYCIISNGRVLKSSLGLIQPPTKLTYGERLLTFETELKNIISELNGSIRIIFLPNNWFLNLIRGWNYALKKTFGI